MENKRVKIPSPALEKLRREREETEQKLNEATARRDELDRQLRRLENRADYLKQGKRKQRTHRLCAKGGVIESLVPELAGFSENAFYDLMEEIFAHPDIQALIREKTQNGGGVEKENV